ncbi:MAG: glycosyltransferase [Candidatus Hydrogenedentota bacterium]
MIYVTVGTMYLDFARLINKMDAIAERTDEQVIIQTGLSPTKPHHCEHFDFRPRAETLDLQRNARVIVAHAGIGAVLDALSVKRPFILVPRLQHFGEHNNDHQMDLAHAVEMRKWGRAITNIDDLDGAVASPLPAPLNYRPDKPRLIRATRDLIEREIRHASSKSSSRLSTNSSK